MTANLFTPIQLGGITLPNRVVIAPMCQYSADDGSMTDWHLVHLGSMACSGAGLFVVEKTNVTRDGRITHGCTGLYNDHNEAAMARAVQVYRGFDLLELHSAHGYLLQQFLSPLANQRSDEYGRDRMKFPLEVARAMREVWPKERALGIRINATDWMEGGWMAEDAVAYAKELQRIGFDFICVSSGATVPHARIPVAPGFQVGFAEKIRKEVGIKVRAVGMIADADQAEEIVASGKADMVAMARAFLDNPRWVWHAAERFGVKIDYPPQYARSHPSLWPGAALARKR